jgi:ribosomal protein S18 acetylase RimI-like enzyme
MLEALVASAREQGRSAVSLSVEPENPARHLHGRFGFQVVSAVNGSLTMLLRI